MVPLNSVVIEARDQVDDAGLARAGGTEQRHGLAGFGDEADVFQHRRTSAGIAKTHPIELDSPDHRRQGDGVRLVHHIALGVEDLEHARGRRAGLADLGDDDAQLGDGQEQIDQIQAELLPLAERERAFDDLPAAEVGGRGLAEVGDHEDHRKQEGEQSRHPDLLFDQGGRGLVELGFLTVLPGESLHHLDPGHVLLKNGVERRQPHLHLAE
jgi:hypothetical protein